VGAIAPAVAAVLMSLSPASRAQENNMVGEAKPSPQPLSQRERS